jgi:hypothetical protein
MAETAAIPLEDRIERALTAGQSSRDIPQTAGDRDTWLRTRIRAIIMEELGKAVGTYQEGALSASQGVGGGSDGGGSDGGGRLASESPPPAGTFQWFIIPPLPLPLSIFNSFS